VAINDVLPLKAASRCAIANVECFCGLGTMDLARDISYAAPYLARIRAIIPLAKSVELCDLKCVGSSAMKKNA